MKNNNPTLHDKTHANNSATAGNAPVGHSFKLGLDVDLNFVVTAIQCERGVIALAQEVYTRAAHRVGAQASRGRTYRAHRL
jgi:hypothetical protein